MPLPLCKNSKISDGNIMVKSRQKFPNRGGAKKNQKCPKFKNFPSKGGGGSQNLGTVPKSYLVINYEGFPYQFSLYEQSN